MYCRISVSVRGVHGEIEENEFEWFIMGSLVFF